MIIVSGGQSGVDRAALDFALQQGIDCHGWCPHGRLAEDGQIDEKYPLKETGSSDPSERTVLNINESDGSLIIYCSEPDEGTRLAIQFSKENKKPVYIIKKQDVLHPEEFIIWLEVNKVKVLNVAGPRESNDEGVYEFALEVMEKLLG